ncbi:MAG: GNAT family N-acetyltransferase [Candidatus Kapaibacterium sp.]
MIEYKQQYYPIPISTIEGVVRLEIEVFEHWKKSFEEEVQRITERLERKYNVLVCTAEHNGVIIGFKIGYEDREHTYYSWLGCVSTLYRKQGIATELMRMQHIWCKEAGYKYVTTNTRNEFKSMLLLNLKNGFEISGTLHDHHGRLKIELMKIL